MTDDITKHSLYPKSGEIYSILQHKTMYQKDYKMDEVLFRIINIVGVFSVDSLEY
jgi:hypothetical protein